MKYIHTKPRAILLIGLLVGLAALFLLTTPGEEGTGNSSAASEECSSCHDIRTFGYRTDAPTELPAGSDFVYELTIINYGSGDGNPHQLQNNEFFLDISGDSVRFANGEMASKGAADYPKQGGEFTVSWDLVATAPGEAEFKPYMNSTAYYNHKSDEDPDEYRYHKKGSTRNISIKDLPIILTDYSFSLMVGESQDTVLAMEVAENITEFRMEIPQDMKNSVNLTSDHPGWTGDGFSNLSQGNVVLFQLNFTALTAEEEWVTLSWKDEENQTQSLQLGFTAYSQTKEEEDDSGTYRKISKLLGYTSFITLVVLFFTGCRSKKVKQCFNGLCGCAKNRLFLHCGLSYFALATALIHGIFHMFRRDTLFIGTQHVFAGDISVFFMGVVAVNGIFQKQMVKRFGFKAWWLTHLICSILAFIAAAIHVYNLNTF